MEFGLFFSSKLNLILSIIFIIAGASLMLIASIYNYETLGSTTYTYLLAVFYIIISIGIFFYDKLQQQEQS